MRSRTPFSGRGSSAMQASKDYRKFAAECCRLARCAKAEHHRKMLEKMAEAWRTLAEEAEHQATNRYHHPQPRWEADRLPGEARPAPFAAECRGLRDFRRPPPFVRTLWRSADIAQPSP